MNEFNEEYNSTKEFIEQNELKLKKIMKLLNDIEEILKE